MAYGGFPAIFSGYRKNCKNRMPIWCIEAEKWNCLDQQMTFRAGFFLVRPEKNSRGTKTQEIVNSRKKLKLKQKNSFPAFFGAKIK